MRALIQRVSKAEVEIDGKIKGKIGKGLLVFLCVCKDDTRNDIEYTARKIANMRIFTDNSNRFNLSLTDINGSCLVISQFTLAADTKKGNRPSYFYAAEVEKAKDYYNKFIDILNKKYGITTASGVFGAHMAVKLINDGPVTIYLDSKVNNHQ